MALQIRRGTDAQRLSMAAPAAGEIIYTTDTKKLYIGDGTTVGGTAVDSVDIVNDTTPQLGGNLDVNGKTITSAGNGNVVIDPAGSGTINLNADVNITGAVLKTGGLTIAPTTLLQFGSNSLGIDGNVYMLRNTYSNTPGAGFTFAQHHSTSDSVNFNFYRTRGTGLAPAAVQNGDGLGDITFAGYTGTGAAGGGAISSIVEGVPSAGNVPMKLQFITNNGTALGIRAEITAAGIFKTNSIQNLSGSQLTLTATTVSVAGNIELTSQNDLRFRDTDSSNWVAFQAPTTVAANVTWTLPAADGGSGQVLTTDGLGTLTWASPPGFTTRTIVSETTASLGTGAIGNMTMTGYKGYILYKVQTSHAARVRIYTDMTSRLADAARAEGVDPTVGSGVVADIVTSGAQTIIVSPSLYGFNNETTPANEIYVAITNKTGGTQAITITLTIVQAEA